MNHCQFSPLLLRVLKFESQLTYDEIAHLAGFRRNRVTRWSFGERRPKPESWAHLLKVFEELERSENLRSIKRRYGLTHERLAQLVGVSPHTLESMQSGRLKMKPKYKTRLKNQLKLLGQNM